MLRGPLHNVGVDGLCEACGEPFPCPTGLAIYDAVKRELECNVARRVPPEDEDELLEHARPFEPPAPARWEDIDDRESRCPKCLHWWVSHGVPTEDGYGCGIPVGSFDARDTSVYEVCGCTFADGDPVTPRQVRIWHHGTSGPTPPWDRATYTHQS
jgi:hypothetical protein